MNTKQHVLRLAVAVTIACIGQAQAASGYDLRDMYIEANGKDLFEDFYNNNNPQTVAPGNGYFGSLTTPNPLYSVGGSLAGAETTPGDVTLDGDAIGQLRFSQANATAPTPLYFNGIRYLDQTNRIRLNDPVGQSSVLNNNHDNFEAGSAWSFVTPTVNSRYGMQFTEAAAGAFNDRISVDIVRLGDGSAAAQMRRVVGDTTTGIYTSSGVETRSLSSALGVGHTIDQISAVVLYLRWNADDNRVRGALDLVQIIDGGATISQLGHIDFNNQYEIFRGENTTALRAGASWSVPTPIPEPSSYALMLVGLAGVGAMAKRRRAG